MYLIATTVLTLATFSLAAPSPTQPKDEIEKRQQNIPELLQLASLAGITSLPTDRAVLLELGPVANQLASALPTSPVLSVLETAAPKSFLSNIVHDPSYATSFESAFAAGSSPSWFNGLPTDVKSYLHTYTGFGGIATAAAEFNSATADSSAKAGATAGSGGTSVASLTASETRSMASNPGQSTSGSSTTTSQTSGTAVRQTGAAPAGTATTSSRTSTAGAAQSTGAAAVGMMALVGVLGVAAAL